MVTPSSSRRSRVLPHGSAWALAALALVFPRSVVSADLSRRHQWIVTEDEQAWVVLGGSVQHYDASTDQWSVLARGVGYGAAREIWLDGDFIWVALDSALCFAPQGSEQWLCFGPREGLPAPVGPLVFDQDFVWAATNAGIARFDRYIEEWVLYGRQDDGLPSDTVTATLAEGEYLWAGTRRGLGRLDMGLERWEGYREVGEREYHDARDIARGLWFFHEDGATVYRTETGAFEDLGPADGLDSRVLDHESFGAELWLVTSGGVLQCDPEAGVCTPFAEAGYLRNAVVRDISSASGRIWLATDEGVYRYWPGADASQGQERWKAYTASQGLSSLSYVRIHADAGVVYALSQEGRLDYLIEADDRWRLRHVEKGVGGGAAWIQLNEEGLRLLGPGPATTTLSGTVSRLEEYEWEREEGDDSWSRGGTNRAELTLIQRVGSERSLASFYDNTDRAHVRYGAKWRGLDRDVFRELGFGWMQVQGMPNSLAGPPESRTGYVELQYGPQTDRLGRSMVALHGWRGRLTARHGETVFRGSGNSYRLDHRDLVPGTVEVRLDDELLGPADYTLDQSTGTLLLTFSGSELVDETSQIAVSYQYRVAEAQTKSDAGGASLVVAPSDLVTGTMGVTSWWERGQWRKVAEFGSELRTSAVVFRPRLGISDGRYGARIEALGRWKWLRLHGVEDWVEKGFARLRAPSSLADTVTERTSVAVRAEPAWWIPLEIGHRRDRAVAGDVESGWGTIELKHPQGPGLQLKALKRQVRAEDGGEIAKAEGFLSWEVPPGLLRRLRLRKLTARARMTRGRLEGWERDDRAVGGEFVQLVVSPARPLFLDGVLRQATEKARRDNLLLERSTRLRGSVRSAGLPSGVTFRADLSGTVAEDSFTVAGKRCVFSTSAHEFYGRAAPGSWWSSLSFFDVDFSYSITRQDSLISLGRNETRWDVLFAGAGNPDASLEGRLSQARLYVRPLRTQEIVLSARRTRSGASRQSVVLLRSIWDPAASYRLTAESSLRLDEAYPGLRETDRYLLWKIQAEGRHGQRGLARATLSGERHTWGNHGRSQVRPALLLEMWGEVLEIRSEIGCVYSWGTDAGDVEYWQSVRADVELGSNLACRLVVSVREYEAGWSGNGEARIVLQL